MMCNAWKLKTDNITWKIPTTLLPHYLWTGWVQESEDILYNYIQHTVCQNACMYAKTVYTWRPLREELTSTATLSCMSPNICTVVTCCMSTDPRNDLLQLQTDLTHGKQIIKHCLKIMSTNSQHNTAIWMAPAWLTWTNLDVVGTEYTASLQSHIPV